MATYSPALTRALARQTAIGQPTRYEVVLRGPDGAWRLPLWVNTRGQGQILDALRSEGNWPKVFAHLPGGIESAELEWDTRRQLYRCGPWTLSTERTQRDATGNPLPMLS